MPRMKILVIEDDLFYQTYVNDLLAETGAQILTAPDGQAGLDLARSELPDLVLSDIEIPIIQGFILLKHLREDPATRGIPVIMMSGKVDRAMMERHSQLRVRADAYLSKPFSSHDLFDALRSALAERSDALNLPPAQPSESPPAAASAAEPFASPSAPAPGARIAVVVDDSRYILDVARDFLGEMGLAVVTAMDGEEALSAVAQHRPEIVFLDVQIPKLNGFVVCERIKKDPATAGIPVVLMSAVVDNEAFERHSRLRYRADAYLPKPFMKRELQSLASRLASIPVPSAQERTGYFVPPEDAPTAEEPSATGDEGPAPAPPGMGQDGQAAAEPLRERIGSLTAEIERMREQEDAFLAERQSMGEQIRLLSAQAERQKECEESSQQAQARVRTLEERIGRQDAERAALVRSFEEERARDLERIRERTEEAQNANAALDTARKALAEGEARWSLREEALKREAASRSEEARGLSDGAQARVSAIEGEVGRLRQDLKAALSAKAEIEEQAKSILASRGNHDEQALKSQLSQARAENLSLAQKMSEAQAGLKWVDDLKGQIGVLEEKNRGLEREVLRVQGLLDTARSEASEAGSELQKQRARAVELERNLTAERDRASRATIDGKTALGRMEESLLELAAEKERRMAAEEASARSAAGLEQARRQAAAAAGTDAQVERLRRDCGAAKARSEELEAQNEELKAHKGELETRNKELEARKGELEARNEKLEARVKDLAASLRDSPGAAVTAVPEREHGEGVIRGLAERLGSLEAVLERTVREAQSALKEQRDHEGVLEQQVRGMASAIEEERAEHRRARERWEARDAEQRAALDQAQQERMRLVGEEISRYIPVAMAREARPLEVVRPRRGMAWAGAAGAVLLLLAAFVLGRYGTDRSVGPDVRISATAEAPPGQPGSAQATVALPNPAVAPESASQAYERLWRRQTVTSVSEDIMVQATLHTPEELRAAIRLAAAKEGWTAQRTEQAMADLDRTFRFDQAHYVTVFSKNLRGGYPGYADGFERHLALRDASGREVPATVPETLRERRFITSHIAAAGKDANPVFLYEVGVTVSFSRSGLPGTGALQLVLYDLGTIPMRVLTWDM